MQRATKTVRHDGTTACDSIVLDHEARHLRRRVLRTQADEEVLVDLAQATVLAHLDRLVLEDGRQIEVIAAEEELLEVRAFDAEAMMRIAWHLGNRHTPVQIGTARLLIARDHVLGAMLVQIGAHVREVRERFEPLRGAYHRHGQDA